MKTILLSKRKIKQLKKEAVTIQKAIIQVATDRKQDGHMHEGIIEEVQLQPKRKRLREIEEILKKAKELPDTIGSVSAIIGSYISLENTEGKKKKFRLVHSIESDPLKNLISIDSPLGKKLMKKKVGTKIRFNSQDWTIVSVL